jgi:aryl-alcohol dehydrogenase-like predicted oxidoreductase
VRKVRNPSRKGKLSSSEQAVSKVIEDLASAKNTEIVSITIAYVMQKTLYVFPLVRGRKVDHIKGNINALIVN